MTQHDPASTPELLTTDLSRRRLLAGAGALSAAAVLSQLSGPGRVLDALGLSEEAQAATASCVLIPSKTEGPYFVDEHLSRSDIRTDTSDGSVQSGVPLTLKMVVVRADGECAVVPGAVVDVWHASAAGLYSDVSNAGPGGSQVGKKYLRGNQTTADDGSVTFTTVFPGWYSGRAIHIHFKVRLYDGSAQTFEFTSQMFFEPAITSQVVQSSAYSSRGTPDTPNSSDNIYGSDGAKLVVPLTGSTSVGFAGTFVIGVTGLPATTATTTAGTSTAGSTGSGAATTTVVEAAVKSRTWRRSTAGRRTLRLSLALGERVAVSARISRAGRTVAKKSVASLATGTRTLDLPIPTATGRGAAHLSVTFTDAAGKVKTVSRTITVPRKA